MCAAGVPHSRAGSAPRPLLARGAALTGRATAQPPLLCDPPTADADLLNAAAAKGRVLVADRGGCTFAEKAARAQAAGAAALIIVNTDDKPLAIGGAAGVPGAGIPVVAVPARARAALLAGAGLRLKYNANPEGLQLLSLGGFEVESYSGGQVPRDAHHAQ